MAVKTILTEPHKILRQISKPVGKFGKEEQKLMKKVLQRFTRNYFCWMYRLRLHKLLITFIVG